MFTVNILFEVNPQVNRKSSVNIQFEVNLIVNRATVNRKTVTPRRVTVNRKYVHLPLIVNRKYGQFEVKIVS